MTSNSLFACSLVSTLHLYLSAISRKSSFDVFRLYDFIRISRTTSENYCCSHSDSRLDFYEFVSFQVICQELLDSQSDLWPLWSLVFDSSVVYFRFYLFELILFCYF
eukprot:UN18910